jgi:hypothetical protein
MAIKHCFYRTVELGDGSDGDEFTPPNPYRCALVDHIESTSIDIGFWNVACFARSVQYAYAIADEAALNSADADADITSISDRFNSIGETESWLDQLASTLPVATKNILEGDGVSVEWVGGATTIREVFRYMCRVFFVADRIGRGKDELIFLQENLDTVAGDISVSKRTAAQTWMQNRGYDISWITGVTTVRDVIHFIIGAETWRYNGFTKVSI